MKNYNQLLLLVLLLAPICHAQENQFANNVAPNGTIALPDRFRMNYVFLGSWFLELKEQESKLMQHVYARRKDAVSYQKTGQWPDGAVLIKEQIEVTSSDVDFAIESYAEKTNGFFVMVKDRKNRFPNNPLWGDGWGWSYFSSEDLTKTTTKDYKKDCLGCHEPARKTDLVFIKGYPILNCE